MYRNICFGPQEFGINRPFDCLLLPNQHFFKEIAPIYLFCTFRSVVSNFAKLKDLQNRFTEVVFAATENTSAKHCLSMTI